LLEEQLVETIGEVEKGIVVVVVIFFLLGVKIKSIFFAQYKFNHYSQSYIYIYLIHFQNQ